MSEEPTEKSPLVGAIQYLGLVGIISFTSIAAILELSTEFHLSAATVDGLQAPFELKADGTAIYRFGSAAEYSIICDGNTPVTWKLPSDREASELTSVCENLQAKRVDSLDTIETSRS